MTARLLVEATYADSLVRELPDVALSGEMQEDGRVSVLVPKGDDPEDPKFELSEYAYRFGIRSIEIVEDQP